MDSQTINKLSDFAAHVGAEFHIDLADGTTVISRLVDVKALQPSPVAREPYSLLFELPEGVALNQENYIVRHDSMGTLSLFMVPVGPGQMESIFN
jgi:hypothetical protein